MKEQVWRTKGMDYGWLIYQKKKIREPLLYLFIEYSSQLIW